VETETDTTFVGDDERLKLIFILCDICKKQDRVLLARYVYVVSRNLENSDFDIILRRVMKIMENVTTNGVSGQDWLMNELFTLYKLG
jgi:hypothetical protein